MLKYSSFTDHCFWIVSTIETENNFLDYHKKKFLTWRIPEKISGMKTQRSENYTLKATDLYH